MKTFLSTLAVTAMLGIATAGGPEAFLFAKSQELSTPPTLPREVARLVVLQRLSPDTRSASLAGIEGIDVNSALTYINKFGTGGSPVFDAEDKPRQMLLLLEDAGDEAGEVRRALDTPAFIVDGPVTEEANQRLVEDELWKLGVAGESGCDLLDDACWDANSVVARFDMRDASDRKRIIDLMPTLRMLAADGHQETLVMLFPRAQDPTDDWVSDLRRRQTESVITSEDAEEAEISSGTSPVPHIFAAIPRCFDTLDACNSATSNCSSHGTCLDRYKTSEGKKACFACACKKGPDENGRFHKWGGAACSKIDISTPFWLFAGFTIIMLFIISSSIGLLYSIGNEELPGVIGAGVSKK